MVDIKTKPVNGHTANQHSESKNSDSSPVRGFVGQAAEVAGNVIELTELQVQLAKEDAADALQMAIQPIFTLAFSGVLLLSSLPVLLFAGAGLLARSSGIGIEFAQLIVGLTASVIATVAALVAIRYLRSSIAPFTRSAAELKQNITWLKSIFRSNNS